MNDPRPEPASDRSADEPVLPSLSDDRVDAMEATVFTAIADERAAAADSASAERRRRARRSRIWVGTGAAAAVVAVAAIIAPSVGGLVSGSAGSLAEPAIAPGFSDEALDSRGAEGGIVADESAGAAESESLSADAFGAQSAAEQAAGGTAVEEQASREIITTASTTVRVDDVEAAAEQVAEAATTHGGYVESMNVGQQGPSSSSDPAGQIVYDTYQPFPPSGTWVTVRVPADELPALRSELSDLGEVVASDITRQDVTLQVVDVQARVDAAQASVDRLTALMSEAGSLADLIAAESALAQRQAELESWQQQLTYLSDQVAMSSLTVHLEESVERVEADPAGFTDGIAAGWNGLIATLNGIVIALGFLLPWLGVAAIAWLIVWLIVRNVRRRRGVRAAEPAAPATPAPDRAG